MRSEGTGEIKAAGTPSRVTSIETKEISGQRQTFYMLQVMETGMKLMVPTSKVATVGLRQVVGKSDCAAQAAQVIRNLAIALAASQCTAATLVKLTVFLTDMENLASYREARNRFFASVTPPAAPAVTLVEVSRLYGADFMIEIEAIAAA